MGSESESGSGSGAGSQALVVSRGRGEAQSREAQTQGTTRRWAYRRDSIAEDRANRMATSASPSRVRNTTFRSIEDAAVARLERDASPMRSGTRTQEKVQAAPPGSNPEKSAMRAAHDVLRRILGTPLTRDTTGGAGGRENPDSGSDSQPSDVALEGQGASVRGRKAGNNAKDKNPSSLRAKESRGRRASVSAIASAIRLTEGSADLQSLLDEDQREREPEKSSSSGNTSTSNSAAAAVAARQNRRRRHLMEQEADRATRAALQGQVGFQEIAQVASSPAREIDSKQKEVLLSSSSDAEGTFEGTEDARR